MGNGYSDSEWDFVGREEEIGTVKRYIDDPTCKTPCKTLCIHGLKHIGKSRLMREARARTHVDSLYYDIADEDPSDTSLICDCLSTLFSDLEISSQHILDNRQCQPCGECRQCRVNERCMEVDTQVKRIVNKLVKEANNWTAEKILFLDNIDVLLDGGTDLKETSIYFLKEITKRASRLKIVFTTSYTVEVASRSYMTYEVPPMSAGDMVDLIKTVAGDCVSTEDRVYMDVIARLCAGLPLAAIMAGSELQSDQGLYTPRDLVELLIVNRLDALSPETYPADDKLKIYRKPITDVTELSPHFAAWFHRFNKDVNGTHVSPQQAKQLYTENATVATTKRDLLKPLLHRNILAKHRGTDGVSIHGVLLDCLAQIHTLPTEVSSEITEQIIVKRMRENSLLAGLNIDLETLRDPHKLEAFVAAIPDTGGESTPAEPEETDTANMNELSPTDILLPINDQCMRPVSPFAADDTGYTSRQPEAMAYIPETHSIHIEHVTSQLSGQNIELTNNSSDGSHNEVPELGSGQSNPIIVDNVESVYPADGNTRTSPISSMQQASQDYVEPNNVTYRNGSRGPPPAVDNTPLVPVLVDMSDIDSSSTIIQDLGQGFPNHGAHCSRGCLRGSSECAPSEGKQVSQSQYATQCHRNHTVSTNTASPATYPTVTSFNQAATSDITEQANLIDINYAIHLTQQLDALEQTNGFLAATPRRELMHMTETHNGWVAMDSAIGYPALVDVESVDNLGGTIPIATTSRCTTTADGDVIDLSFLDPFAAATFPTHREHTNVALTH